MSLFLPIQLKQHVILKKHFFPQIKICILQNKGYVFLNNNPQCLHMDGSHVLVYSTNIC